MGCWNQTCNISNLPIHYNDLIYILPLISTNPNNKLNIQYAARTSYVETNYKILYFPIKGNYNDYGGIENIERDNELIQVINNNVKLNKDITSNNIEEILNEICNQNISNLEVMIVHKKLFDFIIDKLSKMNTSWFINDEWHRGTYSLKVDEYIDNIIKNIFKWKEKNIEYCLQENFYYFTNFIDYKFLKLIFLEYLNDNNINKLKQLNLFYDGLNLLRRGFLCQSGLGSQSSELKFHLEFNEAIRDFCIEKINEIEEEY